MQIRLAVGTKCDKCYYKILTILLQRATSTTLLQSATIIKVRQIKAHWKNTESVWPCKISKIKVPSRALNLTSFGNKKGKTSRAKTSLFKTTVTLVCITYVNISFAYTVTNCFKTSFFGTTYDSDRNREILCCFSCKNLPPSPVKALSTRFIKKALMKTIT